MHALREAVFGLVALVSAGEEEVGQGRSRVVN